MYSTHGFSVSFSSYRLSNTQAHLAYLITFFCHLVNHQLPLPYNFLHFKAPTFCSKTLCKIVNSRISPLQIIHFFFPSSLPSLTLLFFVSYPWAVLYLETKDQSYGLFLDLPLQGFCFSLCRIIGERKMDSYLKIFKATDEKKGRET